MEEYIEKLMVQFTLATGTITKDLENKSVLDDFSSWIVDRKKNRRNISITFRM